MTMSSEQQEYFLWHWASMGAAPDDDDDLHITASFGVIAARPQKNMVEVLVVLTRPCTYPKPDGRIA